MSGIKYSIMAAKKSNHRVRFRKYYHEKYRSVENKRKYEELLETSIQILQCSPRYSAALGALQERCVRSTVRRIGLWSQAVQFYTYGC